MRCGHCHGSHDTVAEVKACASRSNVTRRPVVPRQTKQKLTRGPKRDDTPPWIRYRQQLREEQAERDDKGYTLNSPPSRVARERVEEKQAQDRRLEPRGPNGHILYVEQGPDSSGRGSRTHSQTWVGGCECGWSARAGSVDALWGLHAAHCASGT